MYYWGEKMNEQTKTITTKLTHDMIKKDHFTLRFSYLKIIELLIIAVVDGVLFALWFYGLLPLENKTSAVIFAIPTFGIAILYLNKLIGLLYGLFCMLTKRYKVVTDHVKHQQDHYSLKPVYSVYALSLTTFVTYISGVLTFREHGVFFLERHIYYQWSPMFELNQDQILEHAQIGAPYHVVLVGKRIIMIYHAEKFLLEES